MTAHEPIRPRFRPTSRFRLPLLAQAAARAAHAALECGGETVTYRGLAHRVDLQAGRLAGCGVRAGDRVAVCLTNGIQFAELLHALARLEAVLVPLNTRLTAEELGWQVDDVDPRLVVWDPVLTDRLPSLAEGVQLLASRELVDGERLDAVPLHDKPTTDVQLQDTVRLDAPLTIVYTSGTTGRPKGVVLTHGNYLASALGSAHRLGVDANDRWLAPLPMFHVGGLGVLLRSGLYGTTAVIPDDNETDTLIAALRDEGISIVSLVPTMLSRLLDSWGDGPSPPDLRAVLLGGAPAAPALLDRARRQGFPVSLTYGMTETCSQVATTRPGDVSGDDPSVPPLVVTGVRVVDSEGVQLPCGREGRISIGGPTVMAGYWQTDGVAADCLEDGWLATSDVGALDERGRLTVQGRLDDTIVTGGENVHPAEVEAVLATHPSVAECCVVGEPDDEWGTAVVALVVPRSASTELVADTDLDAHVRLSLAGYKAPRRYVWLAEPLPRTSLGKVSRREARALAAVRTRV